MYTTLPSIIVASTFALDTSIAEHSRKSVSKTVKLASFPGVMLPILFSSCNAYATLAVTASRLCLRSIASFSLRVVSLPKLFSVVHLFCATNEANGISISGEIG